MSISATERTDAADLSCDGFLGGALRIWQPRRGYRAGIDPVLLAAAVAARPGETVLELGCGVGTASLCLGHRQPGIGLTGVEVQGEYADLAGRNAAVNGQAMRVVAADLRRLPAPVRAESFDHVIANPPYAPTDSGTPSPVAGRQRALAETVPLADWIAVALHRLRPGGRLTLIQRADRLGDVLTCLDARVGSVVVRPVAPRAGREASRVLLAAIKGRRGPMRLLAPFVLHDGARHDGDRDDFTVAARAVLRDGAALDLA